MKKIVTIIVLLFSIMTSTNMFANDMRINEVDLENVDEANYSQDLEKLGILEEEIKNSIIGDKVQLNMFTQSNQNWALDSRNTNPTENTNPNDSKYLAPNSGQYGEIKQEGEFRWYVTSVEEKTKLTNLLHSGSSQDYDLYLYRYNQEASKLELINLSKNALGEYEQIDQVIEKGIYFISVHGKVGTGQFVLRFFSSTLDVNYESNNTVPTATAITNSGRVVTIKGIIDNPTDVDVYKLEVKNKEFSKIELISPKGKEYELTYYNGEKLLKIPPHFSFEPGTHYFIVNSPNGGYNQTDQYILRKTIIDDDGINATFVYKTPDNKYWLHKRSNGKYYINEKLLDYAYDYKHEFSDPSSGSHSRTTMYIKEKSDSFISKGTLSYGNYKTSFPTTKNYTNVIKMTVGNVDGFVWRTGSGAHSGPYMNLSFDVAEIIVDPRTAKVVDLLTPNYYYIHTNHEWHFTPRKY